MGRNDEREIDKLADARRKLLSFEKYCEQVLLGVPEDGSRPTKSELENVSSL